jgi:phospholipid transport system transporter-binding protein
MTYLLQTTESGVIRLSGEIAVDDAPQVREQAERLLAGHPGSVVVDLSGLQSAHSAMLSVLLCLLRFADKQKKSLSFRGVPRPLYDLSRVSGLNKVLLLN